MVTSVFTNSSVLFCYIQVTRDLYRDVVYFSRLTTYLEKKNLTYNYFFRYGTEFKQLSSNYCQKPYIILNPCKYSLKNYFQYLKRTGIKQSSFFPGNNIQYEKLLWDISQTAWVISSMLNQLIVHDRWISWTICWDTQKLFSLL